MYHEFFIWDGKSWAYAGWRRCSHRVALDIAHRLGLQGKHAQVFRGSRAGQWVAEVSPTGEPPADGRIPGSLVVTKADARCVEPVSNR